VAAQLGAQKGGFSDINMTPLIDIVLVVLIIMMVSIPVTIEQMGLKLPGPKLDTPPPEHPNPDQLMVAMYEDGTLALNLKTMTEDQLAEQLTLRLRPMEAKNIFIDAHPTVKYGKIVDVMDLAREAGAAKIGFAKMKDIGPQPPTSVMRGSLVKGCKPGGATVTPNVVDPPKEITAVTAITVDEKLKPLMPQIEGCFEQGLAAKPDLSGRVQLRLDIGPEGEHMTEKIDSSTFEDPAVNDCMKALLPQMKFPPIGYQRTMAIQIPVLCSPG
jgi:biopolymer transport protein ExbD